MSTPHVEYLDLEDLYAVVEALVGHRHAVRDHGLLAAAVERPRATVFGEDAYPDLPTKAAALVHSLVTSHPLVDGNKRLGLVALRLFYGLNGVRLEASQDDKVALILAIAEGSLREVEQIAHVVRSWGAPTGTGASG